MDVGEGAGQSSVASPAAVTPAAPATPPPTPPPAAASAALAAPRAAADSGGPPDAEPSMRLKMALLAVSRKTVEGEERSAMIERVADEIACSRSAQRGMVSGGVEQLASSGRERQRLSLEAYVRQDLDAAVKFMVEDAAPDVQLNAESGAIMLRKMVADTVQQLDAVGREDALTYLWHLKNAEAPTPDELDALEKEIVGGGP